MLEPYYTTHFKRDLRLMVKRGKRADKFKVVPDWLLVYKLSESAVIFERTGTHADLFE